MSEGTRAALVRLESALETFQTSFHREENERSALDCIHLIIEDNKQLINALRYHPHVRSSSLPLCRSAPPRHTIHFAGYRPVSGTQRDEICAPSPPGLTSLVKRKSSRPSRRRTRTSSRPSRGSSLASLNYQMSSASRAESSARQGKALIRKGKC